MNRKVRSYSFLYRGNKFTHNVVTIDGVYQYEYLVAINDIPISSL